MLLHRIYLLAVAVLLIASPSRAAPPDAKPEASVRGLAPAQIAAIRAIGRNVLAAKKSAVEDPADAEQITRLRAAVDTLIAAELDPKSQATITPQGQASTSPGLAQAAAVATRETARSDARARAGQMRERSALMASRAPALPGRALSGSDAETHSAGLPIGKQRAQLFERLAQKLDVAMVADQPDRVAQLHALRDQLQTGRGRLVDAPPVATPTLQAMPSTSKTPIRVVSAAEAKLPLPPGEPRQGKPKPQAQ